MSEKTISRLLQFAIYQLRTMLLIVGELESHCELCEISCKAWSHDLDQAIHDLKVAINRVSELLEE